MTQNRSEAYLQKIEYQKQRSKHLRHLYPNKRLEQNEKSKLRGQEKRMKAYQKDLDTVRIMRENNVQIPWYLQDLKPPRE